jgi:hypothetical protein
MKSGLGRSTKGLKRRTPTTKIVEPPSALRDHPDEDAETRNPPRPLEDPGDMTGDDEHCPDGPTEPPDQPEAARRGSRRPC